MSDIPVVVTPVAGTERLAEALRAIDGVSDVATPAEEEVESALTAETVLVTRSWSDAWLDSGLRWVQSHTAGVEQFPIDLLRDRGVVLTSAVGIHATQVSEHAFGLLLGLTRGLATAAKQQTTRTWRWPRVTDLADKTLGIIGLGVIGEAIARKAKAFDMTVIGAKRTTQGYEGQADEVFGPDETTEVFRRSDVVVVILPDAPDTRASIGTDQFAALEGGYFINVGRGAAVDEDALVAALESGTLAGAGLDVFVEEPLPQSSPLWDLPNVLVSPHFAGSSPRYGERLAELFARNLAAFRGDGEWVTRVV